MLKTVHFACKIISDITLWGSPQCGTEMTFDYRLFKFSYTIQLQGLLFKFVFTLQLKPNRSNCSESFLLRMDMCRREGQFERTRTVEDLPCLVLQTVQFQSVPCTWCTQKFLEPFQWRPCKLCKKDYSGKGARYDLSNFNDTLKLN